jgi:acyl carrier protein
MFVSISRIVTMTAPAQTLEEILNLAAAHFKVPREKLTPDEDFFKTLGIDSLQALDLLTRLEHHFRIELPDYELQGVSDFRTLADRIQARL